MKFSARRFNVPAILAFLTLVWLAVPQLVRAADDRPAKVPHNAFSKAGRSDLAAPLREQGEVRVVVGLQTPDEIAQPVDATPDSVKAAAVSARQSRLLERLAGHNVRNVKRLRHHHFIAMTVDSDALNALLADPEVTSVTEDRPVYPVLYDTPGITRADKAWAEGFRGAGQVVAIIDTGVDKTHPFFSGKVVAEACFSAPVGSNTSYCPGGAAQSFSPGSGVPCPDYNLVCWHGTPVAGIATGRTGVLTPTTGGIAPDAGVIAIQVFQRTCTGTSCSITAYDSDIIAALDHVYSLRSTYTIASINMSLGGDLYTAPCDTSIPAYKTIIDNLRSANIATVIAAGNNGNASALTAPGCVSTAVSVGSTTKANAISSFSNSASFLSLLAPGAAITSSVPLAYVSGGFGGASGTSMATPHVAGAWAVLKSAKPTATVSEVLTALQNTGLPITDPRNGIVKSLIQIGNTSTQLGALGVVLGNAPPTVTLTAPANNTMLTAPATVSLSATAADSDGTVSKIEFYRNTILIATVTPPSPGTPQGTYTYSNTGVAVGTYSYAAKVYDNAIPSVVTTSAAALVTVTATSAGSTTGSITLSNVPSRLSGVAPLAVFFDATGTTTTPSTPRPFHDLEYRWDFGDAGSGTWGSANGAGTRPGLISRNSATGPMAAHVFERPGTYTVTLSATNGTTTVSNNNVRITVQDPNVVFAGANTICFSTSGTFTGAPAGSCTVPGAIGIPGATAIRTSDFTAAITTYKATGKRLLFRRGESFTAATTAVLDVTGPGIVGAFGSGALPATIQAVSPLKDAESEIFRLSSDRTPTVRDWRVMDLKFDGGSGARVIGVSAGGGINQATLLRLAGNGLRITVSFNGFLLDAWNANVNPVRHGHTMYDQIAIVDLSVPAVHVGVAGDTSTWGYGTYIFAERLFYAGNTIDNGGFGAVSHVARFEYLGKAVISNNSLSRPGQNQHNIKLHAPKQSETGAAATGIGGGFSRWVVISDNKFVGANNAYTVAVGPRDAISHERVKDVIYERNWSLAGAGTQRQLIVWAQEVTVRNNIFDTTGALAHNAVTVTTRGLEPAPDQVRVYNNTMYSADADNDFVAVEVNATAKNVTVKNNLAYAPFDSSHLMTRGTGDPIAPLVTSNNSSNAQIGKPGTAPLFVGPLSAPSGFSLMGASYAKDAVVQYPLDPLAPPVFSDFFTPTTPLVFRPVGPKTDLGATEQ